MNVTPYERTRWDHERLNAEEKLAAARREVDKAYAEREAHPKNADLRREFRRRCQIVRYALAQLEEWSR